jgi:hypothetical protein
MNEGEGLGLNIGSRREGSPQSHAPEIRRPVRLKGQFPELSAGSMNDISQYGSDEEDDATGRNVGSEAVKHAYRDETWSQKCFTYDPKPRAFVGRRGTQRFFERMPTILQLFELFWPFNLLCKIIIETNRYATEPLDARGNTRGGAEMGGIDRCRIESIHGNSYVHGYEKAT